MKRLIAQRYTVRRNLAAIICAFLTLYFTLNVLCGERSYFRLNKLNAEAASIGGDVAALHTQRVALEDKVSRLRPDSLDPDLLEERARLVLGFDYPTERVLLNH
jgi:cell division protein FtsB